MPSDALDPGSAGAGRRTAPRRFAAHLLRLVLAVALPLLLLAAGLVAWTVEGRRAEVLRGLDEAARSLQFALDREIALGLAALDALGTSPALDAALEEGPGSPAAAAFHAQATALIARQPGLLSIIWLFRADTPAPLVNTLLPPGVAPPLLGESRFPPRPIGEPPAPGQAFREAVETGRPHVGDLVRGPVSGWIMPATVPVRREGRVVAVLAAGLRPAALGQLLRGQAPPGGVAAVVDRGGIVVARSVGEERFVGTPGAAEILAFQRQSAMAMASGATVTLDGTPVYAAYRRLETAPFAVGYAAPRAVVDAPLRRALLMGGGGGLLALLLASLAALWFGRRLGAEVAALGADAPLILRGAAPPPRAPAAIQEVAAARGALRRASAALAESEARFNRAVLAARIGTWEWEAATGALTGSPGREALYGRAPGSLPTREALLDAVHPEDRAIVAEAGRAALAGEQDGLYRCEFRTVWPDGTQRWLRSQGRAEFAADGTPLRMSGAVVDVTERRLAETALRESERRLRLAQDAAGIGAWERDLLTGAAVWSEQEYRLHGLPPGRPPPDAEMLRAMTLPEDRGRGLLFERLREAGVATGEAGQAIAAEYRIRRADDGAIRWLQVFGRALPGPDGRPARVVGVTLDITERRAAEERQALLMREVDHRAKNALAVALSVVQLAPRDVPPEAFAAGVTGRIAAMARAHSLLAAERWAGADLRSLAEGELAAQEGRVRLSGPRVMLAPGAAQPVAMMLHELATNAAKHGALSAAEGAVALDWRRTAEGGVAITWQERGGPPLAAPPTRSGFGARLLNSVARRQLGGEVAFDWSDPAGLTATLLVPPAQVAEAAVTEPAPAAPAPSPGGTLRAARILLVEDEALLAMQAEAWLRALGCEVVGPARDLAEALRFAAEAPDLAAAVLDITLGQGEQVFPVAELLRRRGVPFLFTTGHAGPEPLDGHEAEAVAVLRKPYGQDALAEALARAVR